MFPFKQRKDEENEMVRIRCDDHENLMHRLYRIEGENIAIIALLATLLVLIVERVI